MLNLLYVHIKKECVNFYVNYYYHLHTL